MQQQFMHAPAVVQRQVAGYLKHVGPLGKSITAAVLLLVTGWPVGSLFSLADAPGDALPQPVPDPMIAAHLDAPFPFRDIRRHHGSRCSPFSPLPGTSKGGGQPLLWTPKRRYSAAPSCPDICPEMAGAATCGRSYELGASQR